jgi:hypothetical protein
LLSRNRVLWRIVDFEDGQVFPNATTYTCLLFLQKCQAPTFTYIQAGNALKTLGASCLLDDTRLPATNVAVDTLGSGPWPLSTARETHLLSHIASKGQPLGSLTSKIFQGMRTSANDIYVLDRIGDVQGQHIQLRSKSLNKAVHLERELLLPFLRGEDIKAYSISQPTKYVLVPYEISTDQAHLITPKRLKSEFPLSWAYLQANKAALEEREHGKMRHAEWYGYVYPKNLALFAKPKIITPDIAARASFALDTSGRYSFVSGYGIILSENAPYDMRYLLAVLNSPILDFYVKRIGTRLQQGFFRYFAQYLEKLPIPALDLDVPEQRNSHDGLVSLVQDTLSLYDEHQLAERNKDDTRHSLLGRIDDLQLTINRRVFSLFDLAPDDLPGTSAV